MQSQQLKELKQSLQEVHCPRSIHEVYFFLRGVLAGTNLLMPSSWLGWLFEGKEPTFDSQEQAQKLINNVMGLWNLIASAQQEGTSLSFNIDKFPNTKEGIIDRVVEINKRNSAFIKGLDHAGTEPMEMAPDGRKAFEDLTKADALSSQYLKLEEKEMKSTQEHIDNAGEVLDQLEDVMEKCIQQISIGLDEARKISIQKTVAPHQSKKIARNDPCSCGSGKKYKKCCWLKVH